MNEGSPPDDQARSGSETAQRPTWDRVDAMREQIAALEARVQQTTDAAKATVQQASQDLIAMVQQFDEAVQAWRPTVNQLIEDAQHTVQSVLEHAKPMATLIAQVQRSPNPLLAGAVVLMAYLGGVRVTTPSTPAQERSEGDDVT
jgi:cell division septum initiation protein DivIVA